MMQHYIKELEQDPFNHGDFVEGLAGRTIDAFKEDGIHSFEPNLMYETFLQAIKDLQILKERQRKKCDKLEEVCQDEENRHWQDIAQFQEKNKEAVNLFQDLDERINFVATKVIHLGDQLENINIPRSRAAEAQKLMCYFAEFLRPGPVHLDIFINKDELFEAADVIQKLHMIVQELPSAKFEEARSKITLKYDEIERLLINDLVTAHRLNDRGRMKDIAAILSHFKAYSEGIDAFIEESQCGAIGGKDIFKDIFLLTEKNVNLIKEVFNSPEQVMAKFVLNIYHLKLQTYIGGILSSQSDDGKYLVNLMDLYSKTLKLSKDFSCFKMGTDDTYLSQLTLTIFQKYLDSYISKEVDCLKKKCSTILEQYYDSKEHQKKQLQILGFQDLKRFVINNRTITNLSQPDDTCTGETFLSEKVALSVLQESTIAFQRCQVLSRHTELSGNAFQLFDEVLNCLVKFIDYAIDLALQSIPSPENKTPQRFYFFDTVKQANAIVHLIEKHFVDCLLPLIVSTPKYSDCILKKKFHFSGLEKKLDSGIDRTINAMVGWIKNFLENEQRKNDFKPDTDFDIMQKPTLASTACLKVVKYITDNLSHMTECLDGRNRELAMREFGFRFHRVIYEHLQTFQYNSTGAMCVICDVNEYKKCVKELKSPLVDTLFDTLHALCNLLLVKPENLNQVCSGENLAPLEGSILLNFIQLRSDYKNQKLANLLKGITT